MYFEEWELITEPSLLTPLPLINLSGMATKDDEKVFERDLIEKEFEKAFRRRDAEEIFEDRVHEVRTPDKPPLDLEDPEVFKKVFEEVNQHLGLYCTSYIRESILELLEEVSEILGLDYDEELRNWRQSIEYVGALVEEIKNPYTHKRFKDKYVLLLFQARKVPNDRAISYGVFTSQAQKIAESFVQHEAKAREELGIIENLGFDVPTEEQTEEEEAKIQKDRADRKAEWLKKNKKKPKPEEEEQKDMEEMFEKLSQNIHSDLHSTLASEAEKSV